jgi:hypothetical protein
MNVNEDARGVDAANLLLCPSAQPDMKACRVLGMVGGTAERPELAYLSQPLPVTEELLRLAGPVKATEVFRFAAHCEEKACRHFAGGDDIAVHVVATAPGAAAALKVEGAVHGRCHQVVHADNLGDFPSPDFALRLLAGVDILAELFAVLLVAPFTFGGFEHR